MQNTHQVENGPYKRLLAAVFLLGTLSFFGCGGNTAALDNGSNDGGPKFNSPPPASNVQLKIGDSPSERIIALKLSLKSIQATPASGSKVSLLANPVVVEVTHLAASNQLLAEISMPQGNYKQVTVTTTGATVTYLDANTNQPVQRTFSKTLTSTVNLSPNLKIVSGGNVLNLDVDVAKTVNLNLTNGTVTLNAPVIKVSAQAVANFSQLPETGAVEHITGKVTAVSGIAFTMKSGQSGLPLTFGTDSSTVFVGTSIDSMNGLIVNVQAESLADGTLLATEVDNVSAPTGVAIEGLIAGYTGWGYLNVVMQDGSGSGMSDAKVGSNLALALDDNTAFTFDANSVDMTGLPYTFDVNSIVPGQRVEVQSVNAVQTDPQGEDAGFVTAATVELQKQTVAGAVSNYVDNGDGTASFDLALSADGNSYLTVVSAGAMSVEVHTSSKTALDGVSGNLNGKTVFARGLLFFVDPSAFSLHRSKSLKPYVGGGSSPYFAMAASQISQ